MAQKNFMSARTLGMEELENVNGGALSLRVKPLIKCKKI